jgi:DNA-binding LacI/PurR family transcriptional regulator
MKAMDQHKLKVDNNIILNCDFDESTACQSVTELFSRKEKPTAVFAFNSLMMLGAIKSLKALNKKIPRDVSLICFDEISGYEIFEPKITCILQPIEKLGDTAIKHLIEKIKNPKTLEKNIVLKPKLVVANSCREI